MESVRTSMGRPTFAPQDVGARIEHSPPVLDLPLEAAGESLSLTLVSMGNPHAVAFIDTPPAGYDLARIGPAVEHHELFANRTNFEIVQVLDRSHIVMRVWERGVGETLACGSGACAATVATRLHGRAGDDVEVTLPGGTLRIEWDGGGGGVPLRARGAGVRRGMERNTRGRDCGMTIERERMQNVAPMLRNTPMRARQWSDLMDRDDIALTESESGQLLVVPQNGQLNLHYAVTSEEAGRQGFAGMFAEIEDSIEEARLVIHPHRPRGSCRTASGSRRCCATPVSAPSANGWTWRSATCTSTRRRPRSPRR